MEVPVIDKYCHNLFYQRTFAILMKYIKGSNKELMCILLFITS